MAIYTSEVINGELVPKEIGHVAQIDAYVAMDAAKGLHDDLVLLRVTAGLKPYGPLNIRLLQQSIADCSGMNLEDCPSCQALAAVLEANRA